VSGEADLDADDLTTPLQPWVARATRLVTVHEGEATGHAHVSLHLPSEQGRGSLEVRSERASVRFADHALRARAHLRVALEHIDLRARSMDLSGSTFALQAEPLGATPAPEEAWWLGAELDHAWLRFGEGLTAGAELDARARDGRPLLDLASESGALPPPVAQALHLPDLQGHTDARLEGGTLTLSRARVSSGVNEVQGVASIGHRLSATLLLRSGPLSAGLGIEDGKVSVDLLHGQALLDAAIRRQASER
jgi:hypothetical protein